MRPAPDCQGNPCYRLVPAPSHQSWCLPSSLLCKMRRTEPGEEHTSPEALDSYQTQNRGTARLLPASFRGKSASSRGTKLGEVSCGEGVGLQAARVGHSVPSAAPHRRCSSLGRKPTLPVSVGAELYPLGGSSTGRACSLVLWQLRWGPRAGLGQSGVPPRTLGLEPRMPAVRWSDGGQGGGSRQELSDARPGPCARHHYTRDFSLRWGGHRVVPPHRLGLQTALLPGGSEGSRNPPACDVRTGPCEEGKRPPEESSRRTAHAGGASVLMLRRTERPPVCPSLQWVLPSPQSPGVGGQGALPSPPCDPSARTLTPLASPQSLRLTPAPPNPCRLKRRCCLVKLPLPPPHHVEGNSASPPTRVTCECRP